ncbi:transmembrane protein 53 [Eurytemora carolleeae]|uniref:transmembrane protein 53 n=1 Tax=Eurytemora carolleeae TaxID=1294199 RepID=UPI000C7746CF|nr:transmembrane protein 53 [Eurytemora carolleeae]|eukprot:XP_023335085.1 transmembrane protein 53-like [Eurytemora affinis]
MLEFSRRLLSSLQHKRCFSNHRVVGTFGDVTEVTKEDRQFKTTEPQNSTSKEKPLVILFGWAGANPKNLSKYGQLYSHLGCPTIEFILPTRFIFR